MGKWENIIYLRILGKLGKLKSKSEDGTLKDTYLGVSHPFGLSGSYFQVKLTYPIPWTLLSVCNSENDFVSASTL